MIHPFPAGFRTQEIDTGGATIHTRIGGTGAPVVMLLDRSPDHRIPSIRIDDERGAYVATQHLIDLGHRNIAHISIVGGLLHENDGSPQFDRFRGYRRALSEAGLPMDLWAVVQGDGLMAGGRASGFELLRRFPDTRRRPTAVFVYNDLAAVGVLRALYESGVRVPREMAVIGFHGLEVGEFTVPSLSSVSHPRAALGEMGGDLLLDLMTRERPSHFDDRVLPVDLVVRESCGAGGAQQ